MKRLLIIAGVLGLAATAAAQEYSFQVPRLELQVTLNPDASAELSYLIVFANNSGAHDIDVVDMGLPHKNYDLHNMSASINGQPLLPGTAITLQFMQGQLAGFAGCNSYNGSYAATDNGDGTYGIVAGQVSTGRRTCPADIMTQENNYITALQQSTSAAVQENMFTLSSSTGTLVYYLIEPR